MDILPEYLLVNCFDSGDPSLRDKLLCGQKQWTNKCHSIQTFNDKSWTKLAPEKHITEPVKTCYGLKANRAKCVRRCFALMSI